MRVLGLQSCRTKQWDGWEAPLKNQLSLSFISSPTFSFLCQPMLGSWVILMTQVGLISNSSFFSCIQTLIWFFVYLSCMFYMHKNLVIISSTCPYINPSKHLFSESYSHPPIHLSSHAMIHPSINLTSFPSCHNAIYLSIQPITNPFIHQPIRRANKPSFCPNIQLTSQRFTHPFIHLSNWMNQWMNEYIDRFIDLNG